MTDWLDAMCADVISYDWMIDRWDKHKMTGSSVRKTFLAVQERGGAVGIDADAIDWDAAPALVQAYAKSVVKSTSSGGPNIGKLLH